MKIIVNTSTLIGSGVTQVAVSFLYECLALAERNEYHVFLGKEVAKSINQDDFDSRFSFYLIPVKPLPFLGKGIGSIKKMKGIEAKIKPDAVFSVFGPSWWTPIAPHLQGYAYPHYVFPESPYFKNLYKKDEIKIKISKWIHTFFLNRNGSFFVTETDFVSRRLEKLLSLKTNSVFTVSNTCNSFFRNFKDDKRVMYLPEKAKTEFRFISLCTMQEHKNLTILNKVVPLLLIEGYTNVKFILTIDHNSYNTKFNDNIKDNVINIGRIPPENCPYLFNECDALFLPTLLECFSANYPEAMYLLKPILTSNLPFAIDICKDSAIFFDPLEEKEIVNSIIKIIKNENLRKKLVINGKKVLSTFATPKERAIKYLEILKSISNEKS